jgi:hypothetical protein
MDNPNTRVKSVRLREDTIAELEKLADTIETIGHETRPSLNLLIRAAVNDLLDKKNPQQWQVFVTNELDGDPQKAANQWLSWITTIVRRTRSRDFMIASDSQQSLEETQAIWERLESEFGEDERKAQ